MNQNSPVSNDRFGFGKPGSGMPWRSIVGAASVAGFALVAAILIGAVLGDFHSSNWARIGGSAWVLGWTGFWALSAATLSGRGGAWRYVAFAGVATQFLTGAFVLIAIWGAHFSQGEGEAVSFIGAFGGAIGLAGLLLSHARRDDTALTTGVMYAALGFYCLASGIMVILVLKLAGSPPNVPVAPLVSLGTAAPSTGLTRGPSSFDLTLLKSLAVTLILSLTGIFMLPVLRRMNPAFPARTADTGAGLAG
jgi:hypothetical protein